MRARMGIKGSNGMGGSSGTGDLLRRLFVVGVGYTPVGKHPNQSIVGLAAEASWRALEDAGSSRVDGIFVGNMLSGELSGQRHLGALLAEELGMLGVDAVCVEAACASGAAAFRQACLSVAAGACEVALAVGVEKMTHVPRRPVVAALATAANARTEVAQGVTFSALAGLLMRRYMHEHGCVRENLARFPLLAHENALTSVHAMLRKPVTLDDYLRARMVSDPLGVFDAAPVADGAAAVVVSRVRRGPRAVRVRASAVATDAVSLHDRVNPLRLDAAKWSAQLAYEQGGVAAGDIDVAELHDAFTPMTLLSLEACGFAPEGQAHRMSRDELGLAGRLPICTFGGLKARGHPVGASGLYQLAEVTRQLRGEAGPNQVNDVRLGLCQSIGGSGATVFTHILEGS